MKRVGSGNASLVVVITASVLAVVGLWTVSSNSRPQEVLGTSAKPAAASGGSPSGESRTTTQVVAVGEAVPIGTSGAELVLTATTACIRPAKATPPIVAKDIPEGCFSVDDKNLDLAANRFTATSYGSGEWAVVYGIAGPEAVSLKAWNRAGSADGSIVSTGAGDWVAFYAVLPFEEFVADAEHPVPPRDNVEVYDSAGRVLTRN